MANKKKKMSNEKIAAKKERAAQQKRDRRRKYTVLWSLVGGLLVVGIIIAVIVSNPVNTELTSASDPAGSAVSAEGSESEESGVTDGTTAETTAFEATHYAEIDIEGYGVISVALDGNTAPITVENFVSLAQSGFYDGLTFHRIIEGFMMQGGCPSGDGTGGSDENITGEFSANGHENPHSHTRGAVSMARSSAYDSASSQFFIVHEDSVHLDGQYAVFGYVTDGMDVVDAVCEAAEPTDSNGTIASDAQPVINSVTVTEA